MRLPSRASRRGASGFAATAGGNPRGSWTVIGSGIGSSQVSVGAGRGGGPVAGGCGRATGGAGAADAGREDTGQRGLQPGVGRDEAGRVAAEIAGVEACVRLQADIDEQRVELELACLSGGGVPGANAG